MSDNTDFYLKMIMQLIARQTFSASDVAAHVCPTKKSTKSLKAYNLCDGTRSQAEIGKVCGIDRANCQKMIKRWELEGLILRVPHGKELHPLHIFPISEKLLPKGS